MRRTTFVALAGALTLVASILVAVPVQAQPEEVLVSDFEDGTTQGWFGRGGATTAVSTEQAHTGSASLLTTGRTQFWHGPARDVLGVLEAGASYEIEAFVRLVEGADLVTMTMQRRPTGGDDAFDTVAFQVPASADEWVRVAGSYSLATATNEALELYLESPNPDLEFYVDDVTITMTSPPPDGGSDVLVATDFESGTTEGWGPRGPGEQVAATQADAHTGDWSLLTTGRTAAWNGPSIDVTAHMEVGGTYDFEMWLKLAPDQDPADLVFSIELVVDGESSFDNITSAAVTSADWARVAGSYTLAVQADQIFVYAESASALVDFYLDDFTMSVRTPPDIEDLPPLHQVLADHFPVGAAIDQRELAGAPAELLTRHFNSITAENHMKPESIQPVEGTFTFAAADALVDFAEANGMRIYGHTLVWHSQTPDWFFQDEHGDPLTSSPEHRQLALDRMQAHIQAIADHYGDRVWAWDVVNEAIDDSQPDGLRRSPWYNIIGPDYLAHAFGFARDAFGPDVKLFLNDFNTEFPAKRDAMYDVVDGLLADGVPIDGVGHQLHLNLVRPISWVDDSIDKFRELDVLQAVTELDVSISTSSEESLPAPPPDRVVRQGYYYRDLFEVLRGHSDVLETVTAWGLYDARSWLRTWPIVRPHEAPLFFDDDLQAKPAYWGVVDPSQLPHLTQVLNVPGGTPQIDGQRDLLWQLLPEVVLQGGEEGEAATGFQVRWDDDHLYVLVEVVETSEDPGEARVELYVDDTNEKAGDYQEGDAHFVIHHDGATAGDEPTAAVVVPTGHGYRVEAALPLATPGALGREVGFDIRITGADGDQLSWGDQNHGQDSDTSRWGILTLIEPVGHVDIPRAAVAPAIDGEIDEVWADAAVVTTEVRVEGSPDGAKGVVRLLWDADRLYVLAEVADPHLNADNSSPWEQDSIEIFVDPGNTKSGAFQPDDGQYRVSYENHQSISGDLATIGDNLTSATSIVDGGYVVEASIELNTMTPQAGSFIGLELQVNDATDGVRTAVHTWHDPTGQSFQNTTRWGVARLVDAPGPVCDTTVTGTHLGPVTVTSGTTCVADAAVLGRVTVAAGASLVVTDSTLGPVSASGAAVVDISGSTVTGLLSVSGTTDRLTLSGNRVTGAILLTGNKTGENSIVISGNTVVGVLWCQFNEPQPVDDGVHNEVVGITLGQCRQM
jgi:endo-1,4-beta-xylanase